jgi:hypothetical protein
MNESVHCQAEGFRAFVKSGGKGRRKRNPYPDGSPEAQLFDQGWQEAASLCGQHGAGAAAVSSQTAR